MSRSRSRIASETGTTMIEMTIACGILLVTLAGLLALGAVATMYTENLGHLATRTTEYATDKMEQLLALAYSDASSDTTVFPAAAPGGTGLAVGGGMDPSAPVTGYVDWLASDGTLLGGGTTGPSNWFYERVWLISSPSSGVKQIQVVATVRSAVGGAINPKSTVVALKASQF